MSEPPPKSQTKIAAESNSIEEKAETSENPIDETVSRSSAALSSPSNSTISSPEINHDPKNSVFGINAIQNLSSKVSNPENSQGFSLKDYFPDYQNLFNTMQYFFEVFSPSSSEADPENIPQNNQKIRGRILVESPSGHDIQKFLQIYATSSGLGIFFLDISRLSKEIPNKQEEMLSNFFQNQSSEIPYIFYIPFDPLLRQFTNESYIINHLISILRNYSIKPQKNIIIFSVPPSAGIQEKNLDFFDVEFSLKKPDFSARKQFLATLFENYTPNALDLDFDHLALQLEGWNFMDLRRFVKNAILLFLSERHVHLKPKVLETSFLTNLLEKRIIRAPSSISSNSQPFSSSNESSRPPTPLSEKNISPHDRRFSQQLYQDAASRDYEKLVIILDKLQKGIILQKFERELLGDYAFLLKADSKQALQKLNKAKIRIEKIQRLIPTTKN